MPAEVVGKMWGKERGWGKGREWSSGWPEIQTGKDGGVLSRLDRRSKVRPFLRIHKAIMKSGFEGAKNLI